MIKPHLRCLLPVLWSVTACGDNAGLPEDPSPDDPPSSARGDAVAVTSGNTLVRFERGTPERPIARIPIRGLGEGEHVVGIDYRPSDGLLYGLTSTGRIATIDPMTAELTPRSTIEVPLLGAAFEIDFDPVFDRLHVVSNTRQTSLVVDVDRGEAVAGSPAAGSAVAFANDFTTACRTTQFALDGGRDRVVIDRGGVIAGVGSRVGFPIDEASFDITTDAAGANLAAAVMTLDGASWLYEIDLARGAARQIGTIALPAGERVRAFALAIQTADAPQAGGELVAVTERRRVLSFERSAPHKPCTNVALAGLDASQEVVDIDVRPSTGDVYALVRTADQGTVYLLDPSGLAHDPVTLDRPLVGRNLGIDFDPTGSEPLRIVSDAGRELRVDVATGAVSELTFTPAGDVAFPTNACSNAVSGAASSRQYLAGIASGHLRILDTATNQMVEPDPAVLGTVAAIAGFDVNGRDDTAIVGIETAGGAATTLYELDPATGTVSATLGRLGSGERLRGLARQARTVRAFGLVAPNTLVEVSLTDPSQVTIIGAISGLAAGDELIGVDLDRAGTLHAVGRTNHVYTIDVATAIATQLSTLVDDGASSPRVFSSLSGDQFGIDFDATGALHVISDANQYLRISVLDDGAGHASASTERELFNPEPYLAPAGIAFDAGNPGATSPTLYMLDTVHQQLVAASPDGVRLVGSPGILFSQFSGLAVVGPQAGIARFGATIATLDLATGRATVLGQLAAPGLILGLVAPQAPGGPAFVVSRRGLGATLSSFPLAAPGTSQVIDQITFPPGEVTDAAALDPTTGELWILTVEVPSGRGHLYTLDRLTAPVTATLRSTLVADPSDTTSPYVDLSNGGQGLVISMVFEPTGQHALRIMGTIGIGTELDMRVDARTGAAITEVPIGLPALVATAAAFTTSSTGPGRWNVLDRAGQLYVADPSLRAARPVGGALLPAPSLTGASGFDIAGGDNGLVFAALQRPNEAFSRLYRIELATGRGTEVGHGIATTPLRGLALRVD